MHFACTTWSLPNHIQEILCSPLCTLGTPRKKPDLDFAVQLRASLDRTVADKEVELEQAASAVAAAQAEAAAQEELAELAKGELAEYQRRMAAEVNHARTEALKSVEGNTGGMLTCRPPLFGKQAPATLLFLLDWE